MNIEPDGRKLIMIEDDATWEKLPKDVRAVPVYFRKTATGIEVWPMWQEMYEYPNIRVYP